MSLLLPNYLSYKAHILYEGTSHQYKSAGTSSMSSANVKVKYEGHISGAFVFHKHSLFHNLFITHHESMGECNTIPSAYTICKYVGFFYTHPSKL